jgi:hypothetical protein
MKAITYLRSKTVDEQHERLPGVHEGLFKDVRT